MSDEQRHVASLAHTYFTVQIPFDKKLVALGYETLKPYLQGPQGLELGSGDGDMTKYLVQDFARLTVVDGSAELLAGIPERPNLVKVCSLFEAYEPDRAFHTIVLGHILEHVAEPVPLLARAGRWLADGGRLLAIVPNALSFHRLAAVKMGLLENPCQLNARDLAVGHRRVYTPEKFQQDMEAAGLRVVKRGGIFFKPLSNQQMQDQWTDEMIRGFYELGKDFPENAAEVYVVCMRAGV